MARTVSVRITKDELRAIVNSVTGQLNISVLSDDELEQVFRVIEDTDNYKLSDLTVTMKEVILKNLQESLTIS